MMVRLNKVAEHCAVWQAEGRLGLHTVDICGLMLQKSVCVLSSRAVDNMWFSV